MPAEDAHPAPREQEMTFVRMFQESNQRTGPPAHLVVKKDSKLEVLAGRVLITRQEGPDAVRLSVGEDVWVKVRIDGKESGSIHRKISMPSGFSPPVDRAHPNAKVTRGQMT